MATLSEGDALVTSPLVGTDESSAGVTGKSNLGPGVWGRSLGLMPSSAAGTQTPKGAATQPGTDGVLGEGNNGVRGVCAADMAPPAKESIFSSATPTGAGVWGANTAGHLQRLQRARGQV